MRILHGDHQIASRTALLNYKSQASLKNLQIISLSGADLTLEKLTSVLGSASLFGSASFIIVDGLFSRRPCKDKDAVISFILANPGHDILLWEPKDVSVQLKSVDSSHVERFDLPKHLFAFLDDPTVASFKKAVEVVPVELVFASLITRLRKVLMGQARLKKPLSETRILAMYQNLLTIDYRQKTSASPFDLSAALELWVIKHIN